MTAKLPILVSNVCRRLASHARAFRWLMILGLVALPACLHTIPKPRDQSHFAPSERRSAELAKIVRAQDDAEAGKSRRRVVIDGNDILLPEATPDQIEKRQTYLFDVSVEDELGRSMRELLEQKIFRIETVGADAELVYPTLSAKLLHKADPDPNTDNPLINSGKAQLRISTNKDGVLRPFTIMAWYPGKMDSSEADAWSARREVRVYYGDIRTRVQIISRTEAQGMFGNTFAEHFYVGRVFLRNRSTTKSLAVYTTSMRVPVFFYRKSELPGGLTPAAAERLAEMARARQAQAWPAETRLLQAEKLVREFVAHEGRDPFVRSESANDKRLLSNVTAEERDALVARVLAEWARLSADEDTKTATENKLTEVERRILIEGALKSKLPEDSKREEEARVHANALGRQAITAVNQDARDQVRRVWELRGQMKTNAQREATRARELLEKILRELPKSNSPEKQKQENRYCDIENRLKGLAQHARALNRKEYQALQKHLRDIPVRAQAEEIDGIIDAPDRMDFRDAAANVPRLVLQVAEYSSLADHLDALANGRTPPADPNGFVEDSIEELKLKARRGGSRGLLAQGNRAGLRVNPGEMAIALSPDAHLQRRLIEGGYLWRDAYRPMTFQAVLNSVMFAHAKDPKTRTIQIMETIANIAGGAVGLSGDPSSSTLRAANFFSSVFVPSLRKTIVEDLNKHITNLGEMAMDTVVIIPPNDSVDRYVFFPRGAIYNFPDEFDPVSPAYITGVEGNELFVEAVPVNSEQVVRGGAVDANTLVARALNEGERSESSRLLQIAQTQAKLRTVELANLTARINAVVEAAKEAAKKEIDAERAAATAAGKTLPEERATEIRNKHLQRAGDEARRMTQAFVAYFGPDQSGALAATLASHGVSASDAPPVAVPANTLRLPAGMTSRAWPINVTDPDTPVKSLSFEKKTGAESWLTDITFDKTDARGATAVFATKPFEAGQAAATRKEAEITVSDLGGNALKYIQPVELMPLEIKESAITITLEGRTEPVKVAGPSPNFTATIGKTRATIVFTIPYLDANPALLKLAMPKPAEGTIPWVESSRFSIDAETGRFRLVIIVDASTAKADTPAPKLTVYLASAASGPDDAALNAAKLAKMTLTLNVNPPTQGSTSGGATTGGTTTGGTTTSGTTTGGTTTGGTTTGGTTTGSTTTGATKGGTTPPGSGANGGSAEGKQPATKSDKDGKN